MKYQHFMRYFFPLFFYLVFIFFLSSLSLPPQENYKLGNKISFIDNYEHIIEYFLLSFLFFRAINHANFRLKKNPFFYAIFFAILYGIIDEIHQMFVPLRGFDIYDLLANIIGSSFIVVFKVFKRD